MRRAEDALLLVGGLLILASVPLTGARYFEGFRFSYGPIDAPTASYLALAAFYTIVGTAGVLAVACGLGRLLRFEASARRLARALSCGSDRNWIAAAALVAFVVPLALRISLLREMPVTDDEGCYVFAAKLLAQGRLWADPPPDPPFFEGQFMIAEGRWFTQYPLGWPALLAPFVAAGVPSLANPVYAAVAVLLAFLAARRLVGRRTARLAVLLLLLSPQFLLASATLLAHTSDLMLLCAALLLTLRIRDGVAGRAEHSLLALSIAASFFVRPATALGFCLPLGAVWAVGVWRRRAWGSALAFALPALAMASAFLAVNLLQTGSPWRMAYDAVFAHHMRLDFRFGHYPAAIVEGRGVFQPGIWSRSLALAGIALLRLNLSTFGWCASFLFLPLAWGVRRARLVWAALVSFWVVQVQTPGVGIDIFGPMHFVETAFPVSVLSAVGLVRLAARWRHDAAGAARSRVILTLVVLVSFAAVVYLPPLLRAVAASSRAVWVLRTAPAQEGVGRAVVFAPQPIWGQCRIQPGSFVFYRPTNSPDLSDEVLWVNDLGADEDRRLMRSFPDRRGFRFMIDEQCRIRLSPLALRR